LNFDTLVHDAAAGAIVGAILAVFPLCAGLYRRRWKRALTAAIACILLGAAFGFYGAMPASGILTLGLWRREPPPGAALDPGNRTGPE
jgi:hypothetical protein